MLYSEILQALSDRLTEAVKPAGLLAGYRFVPYPVSETDGERDLPAIRAMGDTILEQWRPGKPTAGTFTAVFQIATLRKGGVVASTLACEAFMNAVEVTEAGLMDPLLDGLLAEPASFRTDSYVPTDLSLTRNITITATPAKLAVRGQR